MPDRMRARVQARLNALGINPFEADRRAGLARGYVNDLLIGKKNSMRPEPLAKLALALECDADYLSGMQATPRLGQVSPGAGVRVEGIIEPGVWREAGKELPSRVAPLGHDSRYPVDRQHWFIVRGDELETLGIFDASFVGAVDGLVPREGEPAVIRRKRDSGEIETSVRIKAGDTWAAVGPSATPKTLGDDEVEVVGLCVILVRTFG